VRLRSPPLLYNYFVFFFKFKGLNRNKNIRAFCTGEPALFTLEVLEVLEKKLKNSFGNLVGHTCMAVAT
jgi:hypothetical protein